MRIVVYFGVEIHYVACIVVVNVVLWCDILLFNSTQCVGFMIYIVIFLDFEHKSVDFGLEPVDLRLGSLKVGVFDAAVLL